MVRFSSINKYFFKELDPVAQNAFTFFKSLFTLYNLVKKERRDSWYMMKTVKSN